MTHLNYLQQAIDPSDCIHQAWELVKRRIWLYIGTALIMAIVPNVVPYIGFLLTAPLMGGFAYVVLKDTNDEPIDFGMFFKGFEKFVPLLLIGLIQAVPVFAIGGIALVATATGSTIFPSGADLIDSRTGALSFGLTAGMIMWVIGYMLFSIVWSWALTFAIPLIIEHNAGIGDVIKLSFGAAFNNVGGLFVLGLWGLLVALLGILALFVGIFVAIPVIEAAGIIAYRQVFPRLIDPPDFAPPGTYTSIFGNDE